MPDEDENGDDYCRGILLFVIFSYLAFKFLAKCVSSRLLGRKRLMSRSYAIFSASQHFNEAINFALGTEGKNKRVFPSLKVH